METNKKIIDYSYEWAKSGVDAATLGINPISTPAPIMGIKGYLKIIEIDGVGAYLALLKGVDGSLFIYVKFKKSGKSTTFSLPDINTQGFNSILETLDHIAHNGYCKLKPEAVVISRVAA